MTTMTKTFTNIYNNNDDSLILGDRGIAGKEYYPISLNPLLLLHIPPHCTLLIFEIIATPSIPPSILPNIPPNCTLISGNDTHLLQKNNNSQHHEMLPNVMCYFQISCVIAITSAILRYVLVILPPGEILRITLKPGSCWLSFFSLIKHCFFNINFLCNLYEFRSQYMKCIYASG